MDNQDNICGNQENLQVAYQFSNLYDLKTAISTELEKEAEGFIRIGYLLKVARDTELFAEDGYSNLYDFAQAEYSLDKSTVSRFMAINDKYSIDGNSPLIEEKYRGFGRAKLAEMLTLPVHIAAELKPETTRREIQELKREVKEEQEKESVPCKEDEESDSSGCTGATNVEFSQTKGDFDTLLQRVVKGIFKKDSFKDKLSKIWGIIKKPYQANTSGEELADTIAYNGYAQGKAAGIFIFFKLPEEGIVCMKGAAGEKEEYTYRDLFICLTNLFRPQEYRDWKDAWEDIYGEEQLPGQMNVNMFPEVIPDSSKEELQEEIEVVEEGNIEDSTYDDAHEDTKVEDTKVENTKGVQEDSHENTSEAAVIEVIDNEDNLDNEVNHAREVNDAHDLNHDGDLNHTSELDNYSEVVSQERCVFCGPEETGLASHDGDFILRINTNGHATIVFDNGEHSERAIFEFKNCPMCGRKLGEES